MKAIKIGHFALLLACLFGCREPSGETKSTHATPFEFHGVHWRMDWDVGYPITKEAFRKSSHIAFKEVPSNRVKVDKATLKGEMAVNEGEGRLVLHFRARSALVVFPVETTLAATAIVRDQMGAKRLLEKGLADAAAAVKEMFRVLASNKTEWLRGLDSAELDIQILSIRLLGASKEKSAARPLAAMLSDPREQVAEVAAEALVEIGDSQTVPLIIASIKRGNLRSEVRAIEIIGRLGGDEAKAYLEMIALGHELQEVRRLSGDLLKEMNAKK